MKWLMGLLLAAVLVAGAGGCVNIGKGPYVVMGEGERQPPTLDKQYGDLSKALEKGVITRAEHDRLREAIAKAYEKGGSR